MTNQEILTKAIDKAIAGGWNVPKHKRDKRYKWPPTSIELSEDYGDEGSSGWWLNFPDERTWGIKLCDSYDFEDLIFNHEFCKALWGDTIMHNMADMLENGGINGRIHHIPNWQFHLQQMVIADDPIAYLGEHLN